jgi:glutathione synthase/RimK-type ligase-like ATP-grasp enzyme
VRNLIVVDQLKNWVFQIENVEVMSATEYLDNPLMSGNIRVFNFCKSYKYQSIGYYVSLVAEARGHQVYPSMSAIGDVKSTTIMQTVSEDLDDLIQKTLKPLTSVEFTLSIYFKHNVAKCYDVLAKKLAEKFQFPMLRVFFECKKDRWEVVNIEPISLGDIPPTHLKFAEGLAKAYFSAKRFVSSKMSCHHYNLAILVDPTEPNPPSDAKAIEKFIEAGKKFNIRAEVITKADFSRLSEFDGLFIRATTSVNNFTYRFARQAYVNGMVVIDDPKSIIRCSNKIFLSEVLKKLKIAIPDCQMLYRKNYRDFLKQVKFPCVIKLPDGSFSKGVLKAKNEEEFIHHAEFCFAKSDLILVQPFLPTSYDWRIGVLDGVPIYSCRYYMANGHWQIYNWAGKTEDEQVGNFDCLKIEDTPPAVISVATKVSKLIGNGLYGLDIKEVNGQVYVIEINDNPNIDSGVEDQNLGDLLYEKIMQTFAHRMDQNPSSLELT